MNAMDEKDLRRLLRVQGPAADEQGRRCPDEARISAYVEHRLSAGDAAQVESHLADCDACLEQVTLLVRAPAAEPGGVAPQLLSRAKNLVAEKKAVWRTPVLRWGAVTATVVFVAVVLSHKVRAPGVGPTFDVPRPDVSSAATAPSAPAITPPAPPTTARSATTPQSPSPSRSAVRSPAGKPLQLELQFPAENATLAPQQLEFRWEAVPAATYYEVQLVTDDGTVVWLGKVEGTRVRPPDAVRLEGGRKYFVWIKAHLTGGGTVKSTTVSFQIEGR
jgi:hypothetical protein